MFQVHLIYTHTRGLGDFALMCLFQFDDRKSPNIKFIECSKIEGGGLGDLCNLNSHRYSNVVFYCTFPGVG